MTEPAQYEGLTDAERDLARVDSHMRECDWPKVADCTECGYRLGRIRLQLKALAEAGWLDPTAANALRAEQARQIGDIDRQWCANIDAAGVEVERAAAATITQLRDERDKALWQIEKLAATIRAFPDAHHAANLAHARDERDRLRRDNAALLPVAQAAETWALRTFGADLKPIDGDEEYFGSHELALAAAVDEWRKAVTDG